MITTMKGCVTQNDLWSWPISSRSFGHDFAIILLKYGTSCHVRSTACTVLDGFFPYLAQMTTSMRWCVACNGLWPWPIHSRSFSHDFAIKVKYDTSCVRLTACTVLHRENVPSAQLPQMKMSSWGNVPNFSLTPIWPGYPQLGCYQYHQPIVLGSLCWRLWSITIN